MTDELTKDEALGMLKLRPDYDEFEEIIQHITQLHEQVARLDELNTNLMGLSPSGICSKYHMQACHCCESMECGDNISPAKKQITDLTHQHTLDTGIITGKNDEIAELKFQCRKFEVAAEKHRDNFHAQQDYTTGVDKCLAKYEKPCDVCGGSGEVTEPEYPESDVEHCHIMRAIPCPANCDNGKVCRWIVPGKMILTSGWLNGEQVAEFKKYPSFPLCIRSVKIHDDSFWVGIISLEKATKLPDSDEWEIQEVQDEKTN